MDEAPLESLPRFSVPGTGVESPGWTDATEMAKAAWEPTQNGAVLRHLLKLEETGRI